jgi:hypothetical protein
MTKKHPAPLPPLTYNGYDFSYSLSLLIGHYLQGARESIPGSGIINLFTATENLVSDIPAGDGKIDNLFLQCIVLPAGDSVNQAGWGCIEKTNSNNSCISDSFNNSNMTNSITIKSASSTFVVDTGFHGHAKFI